MTVVKSSRQEFARPWHKGKQPQNVANLQINAKELVESKTPQNVSNLQINAKELVESKKPQNVSSLLINAKTLVTKLKLSQTYKSPLTNL